MITDNSLRNESITLQMNFFSLLVYSEGSFYSYLTVLLQIVNGLAVILKKSYSFLSLF